MVTQMKKKTSSPGDGITRVLAAVGASFLIFVLLAIFKFVLAILHNCHFDAAFLPTPPRDAFADKVVWITGASSGIGRALAMHLCSSHDNVKLILSSRRQSVLEEVAKECKTKGNAEARVLTVDLADHASLLTKAKEAVSMYNGRIDVLMNNGGLTTRSMARNSDFEVDKYVTGVDYLSYVAITKALLPSWERHSDGGDNKKNNIPTIINTSSVAGKFGVPVRTAYCGAKHALQGWMDSFRIEQTIVGHPINVLNVVLGSTRTNISRNAAVESPGEKFGDSDANIEAGLDPDFVVERVLASAYVGLKELWIAPRKELVMLYLNQYVPELSVKVMMKTAVKQYTIQKENTPTKEGGEEL